MNSVPSILMVTWNRREYLEKTLANLLADRSDFRIYFWDNGSVDGVSDIISELKDDRIEEKHFNRHNVGQFSAWHWFLDNCRGDIAGKLDDDIIGEHGWMSRFSSMIMDHQEIGVLGGWVFLPSEWDEDIAKHKFVNVGRYTIFRNCWIAGCIFLGRLTILRRYSSRDAGRLGVPLDQARMTKEGYINGFPLPVSFAHNMDDPRSPHCRMNRPGGWDQFAAYTARMRNFASPEEYANWIAADARKILETPVMDQVRMMLPTRADRLRGRIVRGLTKLVN